MNFTSCLMKISIVLLSISVAQSLPLSDSSARYPPERRKIAEPSNNHGSSITYEGTKWCGPGSMAVNFADLGEAVETDKCCRTHDNCPLHITAGSTAYSLTNDNPYTMSLCDCDRQFLECLRRDDSEVSQSVRLFFFYVLPLYCFEMNDGAAVLHSPIEDREIASAWRWTLGALGLSEDYSNYHRIFLLLRKLNKLKIKLSNGLEYFYKKIGSFFQ